MIASRDNRARKRARPQTPLALASSIIEALSNDPVHAYTLLQGLFDRGASVHSMRNLESWETPLHVACRCQTPAVIKLLLDKGSRINVKDRLQVTPLFRTATEGKAVACQLLLNYGADTTVRRADGEHVLETAARHHQLDVVKVLLNHGVDINMRNGLGFTALSAAVENHEDRASDYRDVHDEDFVSHPSPGQLEMINLLLQHGTDIHARHTDGATVLFTAASSGSVEIVQILLDHGADPNAIDDCYRKPLWMAVRQNSVAIVKLLLPLTKNIDDQVYNGHTCLTTAARWGHQQCVHLLLNAGAEIWSHKPGPQFLEPERRIRWYGLDALYWACVNDEEDNGDPVTRLILVAGAVRPPESISEGVFAHYIEIWDSAWDDTDLEMAEFWEWVRRRSALSNDDKVVALRDEIRDQVYKMSAEKEEAMRQELGLVDDIKNPFDVRRGQGSPVVSADEAEEDEAETQRQEDEGLFNKVTDAKNIEGDTSGEDQ